MSYAPPAHGGAYRGQKGPLTPELQTVVSPWHVCWDQAMALCEQWVLLIAEPSLSADPGRFFFPHPSGSGKHVHGSRLTWITVGSASYYFFEEFPSFIFLLHSPIILCLCLSFLSGAFTCALPLRPALERSFITLHPRKPSISPIQRLRDPCLSPPRTLWQVQHQRLATNCRPYRLHLFCVWICFHSILTHQRLLIKVFLRAASSEPCAP